MFGIFVLDRKYFFMPIGDYQYQISNSRQFSQKLIVQPRDVIELANKYYVQVEELFLPEKKCQYQEMSQSVKIAKQYLQVQQYNSLSYPKECRQQQVIQPMINLMAWSYFENDRQQLSKASTEIQYIFKPSEDSSEYQSWTIGKICPQTQQHFVKIPGIKKFQIKFSYKEKIGGVFVQSAMEKQKGGSQKLAFIDKNIQNFMPKVLLLHKSVHLTHRNPELKFRNIVEIIF